MYNQAKPPPSSPPTGDNAKPRAMARRQPAENRSRITPLIGVFLALGVPTFGDITASVFSSAYDNCNQAGGEQFDSDMRPYRCITLNSNASNGKSSTTAMARSTYGAIELRTTNGGAYPCEHSSGSHASGGFSDAFMVVGTDDGHLSGELTAMLAITPNLSVTGVDIAEYTLNVQIGSYSESFRHCTIPCPGENPAPPLLITPPLPYQCGQSIPINISATVDCAGGGISDSGSSVADLVVEWMGISGPPPGAQTTGAIDWATSVDSATCSFVRIEVVDPNPALRTGALVTSNLSQLASDGEPVVGFIADGATPLVLRLTTGEPGQLSTLVDDGQGGVSIESVGQLRDARVPSSGNPLIQFPEPVGDLWRAFVVLTAPTDFVRDGNESDPDATRRSIRANVQFVPTDPDGTLATRSVPIVLGRPPVVFVHGLWSTPAKWMWPVLADERFLVERANYEASNAAAFATNVPIIRCTIEQALYHARLGCMAATQVDVFGHSMGGLLARLHAGAEDYRAGENFDAGDINKLVTLGTPHFGSEFANLLVSSGGVPTALGRRVARTGKSVTSGAVRDLRVGSSALSTLPATDVPSHAMIGKGGSDLIAMGFSGVMQLPATDIAIYYVLGSQFPFGSGVIHDMIVSAASQTGALASNFQTALGFVDADNRAVHSTEPTDQHFSDQAIMLLNAPPRDLGGFAPGFPAPANLTSSLAADSFANGTSKQLTLVAPAPGTVVEPGAQLLVRVEPVGGFAPVSVVFILEDGPAINVTAPPYETLLTVPLEAFGRRNLVVFGTDAADAVAEVPDEPFVVVTPSASLTSLRVRSPEPILFAFTAQAVLFVEGAFADGVTRDIPRLDYGLTFSSDNSGVATVANDGNVMARSVGTTAIYAHLGPVQSPPFPIIVHSVKADANRDGRVNFKDAKELFACYREPDDTSAGRSCHDFFDFDFDRDVDVRDTAAFMLRYSADALR